MHLAAVDEGEAVEWQMIVAAFVADTLLGHLLHLLGSFAFFAAVWKSEGTASTRLSVTTKELKSN
jgi:hypothetical protein